MSYRKTYEQIKELILHTALDTPMCRDIVRRAGLTSGSVEEDGSLLEEQFFSPLPPDRFRHIPRRRVQNGLAWPYQPSGVQDGDTYWDARTSASNITTGDASTWRFYDTQKYYNMLHFTNYSEHRNTRLGANLVDPGQTNQPQVGNPPARTSRAWVGGSTTYDPFPFPSAPLYLWADLSEAIRVEPFINFIDMAWGTSPYRNAFGTVPAIGQISLRLYGSLDNGSTWGPPFEVLAGNAGSAYGAMELNSNYNPSAGEDGYGGGTQGALRPEFQVDDVLFKFRLTSADAGNWIEFEDLGIRAYGIT